MIQGVDQAEILHELNNLNPVAGIANSDEVIHEYIIQADQELDYTASIASATTVTVAELPTNTVSILVMISIYRATWSPSLNLKRKSTDVNTVDISTAANTQPVGNGYMQIIQEIPTYQNSFYVVGETTTCDKFKIFGYKIK